MGKSTLRCALIGMGAAGSGLAVEAGLHGMDIASWYDTDPAIGDALAFAGGLSYEGQRGVGMVAMPPQAPSNAEAVAEADLIFVSTTADRHAEVANSIASAVKEGQIVVLNCGYVGGSKIFRDTLEARGARLPRIFELNNTLHLCGKINPATLSIRGHKRWLEIAGDRSDTDAPAFQSMMTLFPEFEFGENVLQNGLNNPNCIGHVPAYVGGAVLLDRDLGEMTSGILHFDEAKLGRVSRLCNAFEAERDRLIAGIGLRPLPVSEFGRRAYPAGSRIVGGIARFGPKLQRRFVHEDVPCSLVPMESLGHHYGIATPVTSALIDLAGTLESVDFRAIGRTVEVLSAEWIGRYCRQP